MPKEKKSKIKNFKMSAVIPVMQYGNIQPSIELEVDSIEEGTKTAMDYVNSLFSRYGESGSLKERTINATVKMKSFNEDVEVDFDPINHVYTYNGVKLVSATEFTAKFYKKFDSKAIAKVCAKSWEVPQEDIESMWSSNGHLADSLGTLIHQSLEHYDKFSEMGEKISAKNGKDNPAMPKHPILKKIIEDFKVISPHGENVRNEVLLTNIELGYCGMSDKIIITGEKKCRVQDYKININSNEEDKNMKVGEPFQELPATKISKYQLQMSVYANLLQKSGWEVEGLDVFVLEHEWLKFELSVLTVI